MDKRAWRKLLRERRAAASKEQRARWAAQMIEHFFQLPEVIRLLEQAGTARLVRGARAERDGELTDHHRPKVLLYAATGDEAPTRELAESLQRAGVVTCLPRLDRARPGEMDVVPFDAWSSLVSGPFFDIPQPGADAEAIAPDDLDAIIIPAVGLDMSGRRLGQGGGYYDRFLAQLPAHIIRIGWVFSLQVVDELPEEDHDRGVDVIVTENGVIRPQAKAGSLSE